MDNEILAKITGHSGATEVEMAEAVAALADGSADDSETAAIRGALLTKSTPFEELVEFTKALRAAGTQIAPAEEVIEVAGSGGSISKFNNSVAAAIIAAAGGAKVAKLVMPASAGVCGDADVIAALGIDQNITPDQAVQMINDDGLAFIPLESVNPAAARLLAGATEDEAKFFCAVVGPQLNPASPTRCFVGVSDPELLETASNLAKEVGVMNALFVHGEGGVDEISMIGNTKFIELANGRPTAYDMKPEDNALEPCKPEEVNMGSPKEASYAIRSVLSGKLKGPRREAVVLNASAALMASGKAGYMMRGLLAARNAIDNDAAIEKLEVVKKKSNSFK